MTEARQQPMAKIVSQITAKEVVFSEKIPTMLENGFDDQYDDKMSILDAKFLDMMNKETVVNKLGHYEMPLPFPDEEPNLPNNRQIAEKRLQSLKNKMARNANYNTEYMAFMEDIIRKGYAEACKTDPPPGHVWYIPHHGVYHPKKKKIRVVFDCAATY